VDLDHHSLSLLWLKLQQVGGAKIIAYWGWGNKIMIVFFYDKQHKDGLE